MKKAADVDRSQWISEMIVDGYLRLKRSKYVSENTGIGIVVDCMSKQLLFKGKNWD